MIDKFD